MTSQLDFTFTSWQSQEKIEEASSEDGHRQNLHLKIMHLHIIVLTGLMEIPPNNFENVFDKTIIVISIQPLV